MKSLLATASLSLALMAGPVFAQGETAPATPSAEAATPTPIELAIGGFHVTVLEDSEGGIASVQSEEGDNALIAFLSPDAAEQARTKMGEGSADMKVHTAPLLALFANWDGAIIFESSADEVASARKAVPEAEGFLAPVFFVTTDGHETQINTGQGPITPILLSYNDASEMVGKLKEQGVEENTIEIVPIEMAAVLQQLNSLEEDMGYRFFTHPGTVELIQAAAVSEEATAQ